MFSLIGVTILIIVSGISTFFVLKVLKSPRRSLSKIEINAVNALRLFLAKNLKGLENDLEEVKNALDSDIEVCIEDLNKIESKYKNSISERVREHINQSYLHKVYKTKFKIIGKHEFDIFQENINKKIFPTEDFKKEIKDVFNDRFDFKLSQKGSDTFDSQEFSVHNEEVKYGLLLLLKNKERFEYWLGRNPEIYDAAKILFFKIEKPLKNESKWNKFKKMRSAFNLTEILSILSSPNEDELYQFLKKQRLEPQANNFDLASGSILLGIGIVELIKGPIREHLDDIVLLAAKATMPSFFSDIIKVVWDWIQDWIIEHFGQEALNEVLQLLAEIATGIVIITGIFRIARYVKLARNVKKMWTGEEILPDIQAKFISNYQSNISNSIKNCKNNLREKSELILTKLENDTVDKIRALCSELDKKYLIIVSA